MKPHYPLVDKPTDEEVNALGFTLNPGDPAQPRKAVRRVYAHHRIKAVATGEQRKPRKGEWYLSGATVEAYRAPNDLNIEFMIAKLIRV